MQESLPNFRCLKFWGKHLYRHSPQFLFYFIFYTAQTSLITITFIIPLEMDLVEAVYVQSEGHAFMRILQNH